MLATALRKVSESTDTQIGTRPVSDDLGKTNYIHEQGDKTKITSNDKKQLEGNATLLSAAFIPAGIIGNKLSGTSTGDKTRPLSNKMRDITGYAHVAGHMINNNLGGLGNTAPMVNIIPFTHLDNMQHLKEVERDAKTANKTHNVAFGTVVLEHANVILDTSGVPQGVMENVPHKIESGYIATDGSGKEVAESIKKIPVNFAQSRNTNSGKKMNYNHVSDSSSVTSIAFGSDASEYGDGDDSEVEEVLAAIELAIDAYRSATSPENFALIHQDVVTQLQTDFMFDADVIEYITEEAINNLS